MIFKTLVSTTAAIAALASSAAATMAPTYPSPGTVWTAGKEYTITWNDDGTSPKFADGWTNFKIDFMTGSNLNQTFLSNVVSDLDATKLTSYTWTAPAVDPYSAVYFFMFSNSAGDAAWTTRFGIVAKEGEALTPEPEKTQPDGSAIPWGVGKLASSSGSGTVDVPAAPASSAVVASSSAPAESSSSSAAAPSSDVVPSPAAPAESPESSDGAAPKDKADVESGVEALRVPLAQVGLAIVAAGAYILA